LENLKEAANRGLEPECVIRNVAKREQKIQAERGQLITTLGTHVDLLRLNVAV